MKDDRITRFPCAARLLLGQPETLVAEDLELALRAIEQAGAYRFARFLADAERR
jgi:hypothetical protein